MRERLSVWEGEGGSLNEVSEKALTGTVNQIEWAKQIRMYRKYFATYRVASKLP
jgi:hypothetical protein